MPFNRAVVKDRVGTGLALWQAVVPVYYGGYLSEHLLLADLILQVLCSTLVRVWAHVVVFDCTVGECHCRTCVRAFVCISRNYSIFTHESLGQTTDIYDEDTTTRRLTINIYISGHNFRVEYSNRKHEKHIRCPLFRLRLTHTQCSLL